MMLNDIIGIAQSFLTPLFGIQRAFERIATAQERQAAAMEASNEFEKELNEVPEAPEKGVAPIVEPLYVPDGVEPASLKISKVIPFPGGSRFEWSHKEMPDAPKVNAGDVVGMDGEVIPPQ